MEISTCRFNVRSYECDTYGHVNNAVYLNYLEFARMQALEDRGFTLPVMQKNGYLVVVKKIEIEYHYPLFPNEEVVVKTFSESAKNSSGVFKQQVLRDKDEKLSAEAIITWVFINLQGRPIPIPPEVREAFGI